MEAERERKVDTPDWRFPLGLDFFRRGGTDESESVSEEDEAVSESDSDSEPEEEEEELEEIAFRLLDPLVFDRLFVFDLVIHLSSKEI